MTKQDNAERTRASAMTAASRRAYHSGSQMRDSKLGGGAGFRIPLPAQEMIDALRKLFDAAVVLYDGQRRKHHVARDARGWFSLDSTTRDGLPVCHAEAAINDRWTISVWSRRRLHPDAQAMVRWAAGKLAPHFPERVANEPTVLEFRRGGGTPGSAEVEARTLVWRGRNPPGRKTPTS
jgi:hypothetical protein